MICIVSPELFLRGPNDTTVPLNKMLARQRPPWPPTSYASESHTGIRSVLWKNAPSKWFKICDKKGATTEAESYHNPAQIFSRPEAFFELIFFNALNTFTSVVNINWKSLSASFTKSLKLEVEFSSLHRSWHGTIHGLDKTGLKYGFE